MLIVNTLAIALFAAGAAWFWRFVTGLNHTAEVNGRVQYVGYGKITRVGAAILRMYNSWAYDRGPAVNVLSKALGMCPPCTAGQMYNILYIALALSLNPAEWWQHMLLWPLGAVVAMEQANRNN
jgi:hypothetical protein